MEVRSSDDTAHGLIISDQFQIYNDEAQGEPYEEGAQINSSVSMDMLVYFHYTLTFSLNPLMVRQYVWIIFDEQQGLRIRW